MIKYIITIAMLLSSIAYLWYKEKSYDNTSLGRSIFNGVIYAFIIVIIISFFKEGG